MKTDMNQTMMLLKPNNRAIYERLKFRSLIIRKLTRFSSKKERKKVQEIFSVL
jgi:hypothetical protein